MLTGTCLNCGTAYWGWALSEERHQTCPECGSLLKVMEHGKAETQNSMWRERVVIQERPSAGEQKKSAHKAF
jgi:DNA-directed RNA polymerase subunit RPC12/RpoP